MDACTLGVGVVITLGLEAAKYWVWQYEFPDDIKTQLFISSNYTGTLTINDL